MSRKTLLAVACVTAGFFFASGSAQSGRANAASVYNLK